MRIIAGNAKGTILTAPAGRNTRPTLGRIRESIFNVLSNMGLLDTQVLDIFAGTGAMGIEALSRGAEQATFLDRATTGIIYENLKKCHVLEKGKVMKGDIQASLQALTGNHYDYIFMDPPYKKGYIDEVLNTVFACRLPANNAIIIAEHSVEEPPDMIRWKENCRVWKEKKVGGIVVSYLLCENSGG